MESDYKTELEHCRSEIENYQLEIEQLKRYIETVHLEGSGDNNKITKDVEMQVYPTMLCFHFWCA